MFSVTTVFGLLLLQGSHLTCFVRAVGVQVLPGQPSRASLPWPDSGSGRSSKGSKLQHSGFQLHCSTGPRNTGFTGCSNAWRSAKCTSHKWPNRGLGCQQPWCSKHCWRWWVSVSPVALWGTNRSCWLLEHYKTKQKLWRRTLDAQIRRWMSVSPRGREPGSVCIWTGRPSLVHSHLRTGLLLGAAWKHQGRAKHARVRLGGWRSAKCHQLMLPWHWAWSTAMLTRGEQPLWADRGLWRRSTMTKGSTNSIERDMS